MGCEPAAVRGLGWQRLIASVTLPSSANHPIHCFARFAKKPRVLPLQKFLCHNRATCPIIWEP